MDADVIIENLTELLTNTVNMTSVFYDIFLNPEPMQVTLQQYDDNNQLITVTIPNRAMERQVSLTGEGSPENREAAALGVIYVDTENSDIYVKARGEYDEETGWPKTGWVLIPTELNVEQVLADYLSDHNYVTASETDKATDEKYGVVKIDNETITNNSSNQVQVVGIIDANSGRAKQFWVGTQGEFESIDPKDPDTIYYILEN